MGYKLCTAEKPSVARDIARVIGATHQCDGYLEGNGYLVTWAVGHLVGLAEPEDYGFVSQKDMYADDESKTKAYAELPLIPESWNLIVLESTKKQFGIVKELMHRADVDEIIDCGDMGAEGHILQWFIRKKAGCTKPVRRFCATSMTDEAIKDAMAHLRPISDFDKIIQGEFCKKKADWILGMSLSRAESIKYGVGINVGRVQSPTLGFVVSRFRDVQNFRVTNYYTMEAVVSSPDGNFKVFWNKDTDGCFTPADKDTEGRVLNGEAVKKKAEEILTVRNATVTELVTAKKATDRPQLYDITELQRDANRKYGYSAAVTLATAQALYETQKVLSYPRTDSRYITEDLVPYMPKRIDAIAGIEKYSNAAKELLNRGLNIDKKIVDNSKVTDHHALIPTEKIKGFNPSLMKPTDEERKKGVSSETMQNVLDLVLTRLIVAFSPAYKYEQTNVTVTFGNGMKFTASGKKPVSFGWKAVQDALCGAVSEDEPEQADEEQLFPSIQKGQSLETVNCTAVPKKTTPPKLHTEATLLTAMENAGQHIENGAILKGRGIGTQATRAEIIKKLFDTECVETKVSGKTNYIVPTQKGLTVIGILPPELYSPKITADWELKIADIADGKATEDDFMRDFIAFIKEKTLQVKQTEKREGLSFFKERETFGVCPWCGEPIYRWEDAKKSKGAKKSFKYYCSSKSCKFAIYNDAGIYQTRLNRNATEKEMRKLLSKGFFSAEAKKKDDRTKTYRAVFSLGKKQKEINGVLTDVTDIVFEFAKTK